MDPGCGELPVERGLEAAMLRVDPLRRAHVSGGTERRRREEDDDLAALGRRRRRRRPARGRPAEQRESGKEREEEQRARHVSIETPTAASCRQRLRYADGRHEPLQTRGSDKQQN